MCILDDEFWLFAYEVLRVENENALKNCNGWSELSKKKGFHSSKKNFKNKLKRLLNSLNM
ncbi:hypothetical protein UBN14_10900 [Helicobacter pylori]